MAPRTATDLARYEQRKAARHCVDCAAGLQETDGLRCLECHETKLRCAKVYRATERAHRLDANRQAAKYARRRAAGLCVDCGAPAEGRARCEAHRLAMKLAQQEWLQRREEATRAG